jgi:phosphoglucomutase
MNNFKEKALLWCNSPFDTQTQKDVKILFNDPSKLEDAFYKELEFGTGGMRGIMGVGTNRINKYTLAKAAQGLSSFLKSKFKKDKIKVVIAYDCRHNNELFSKIVSDVLLANNIDVYLYSSLRTTPQLSFSVRHLNANCGIVLTASHNPSDYNGFKVYWDDGGQLTHPLDKELMDKINGTIFDEILYDKKGRSSNIIDKDVDNAFYDTSINLGIQDNIKSRDIKIVYTPLHGSSIVSIPEVLRKVGYKSLIIVKEQAKPDGDFPTVKSPNPEDPKALKMAIDLAEIENAELVIGTDPDSDRLGVAVKNMQGKFTILNGNQTMLIMAHFLLSNREEKKLMKPEDYIASTIVSSSVIEKVANRFGVKFISTLTGFKWIGKEIEERKTQNFIFGGEESFGYLIGDEIRDKDAVTSSLLICEMASMLKTKNKNLYDYMIDCYKLYGPHKERLLSYKLEGITGELKIKEMMRKLRDNPPKKLNNQPVEIIEDYLNSTKSKVGIKHKYKINLPESDVLIFTLKDKSTIAVRPSGTEPKIKFYFSVNSKKFLNNDWELTEKELDNKIDSIIFDLNL